MSFTIPQHFATQWGEMIYTVSQQDMSRLRDAVDAKTDIRGRNFERPRIGTAEAVVKASRHGDTPIVGVEHSRRFGTLVPYEWADLIDDADQLSSITDPANAYSRAATMAMGRAIDRAIIAAMTGAATSGAKGTETVTLPTSQTIAKGSGDAAKMTVAKLRAAAKKLNEAEAPNEHRYFALSAQQLDDLLGTTEVTSADYNTVRALVMGELNTFLGFRFIRLQLLKHASSTRTAIAWQRDGVCLGLAKDVTTRIEERADKSYSTQVYACMMIGAVRLEENRVVAVESQE